MCSLLRCGTGARTGRTEEAEGDGGQNEQLRTSTVAFRRSGDAMDVPLDEREGLLLGPYLLESLRVDLPLGENACADGPLDGGLYADLARDV